jgi:signal transduction histidine kinase
VIRDYLDGLASGGVSSLMNDGREIVARARGGDVALFLTIGRIGDREPPRYCAVMRDLTQWKAAEAELVAARMRAEKASAQKSDFLAKMSHEIRTPLNAIIGFAEVMLEERFGALSNERYREYLKDIRASGEHIMSLVNDLLDLSKVEAGRLELSFDELNLNDIVEQSVAIMQPQANCEQVIIRTSLARGLPPILADARSMRQVMLNVLSNAIKFTPPGGQAFVSTALGDDAVIRGLPSRDARDHVLVGRRRCNGIWCRILGGRASTSEREEQDAELPECFHDGYLQVGIGR